MSTPIKRIEFIDGYTVDESGNIYGKRLGKKLKTWGVYPTVSIRLNGKTLKKYVHRLVAEAFIPNPENKPFVNHKNGIKTDNRVVNLEWVTKSENEIHAYKTKLKVAKKGHLNKLSNFTELQVKEIRCKYQQAKYSQRKLAKEYNVSANCIKNIVKRRTYKEI